MFSATPARMTRRQVFLGASLVLLVIALVSTPLLVRAANQQPANKPVASRPDPTLRPLKVSAMVIRPAVFAETLTLTGTVRAEESVELSVETTGKLTGIFFTEGASVRAGELLARINDAELRAELKSATYRLELAGLKERRVSALLGKGGANQQDFDVATNELQVLRAETDLITAQLAKTELRAPFDGVVGLRLVSEGAQVTTATRLATLQNIETVKLDFAVPEKYAALITPGRAITFAVAGGAQRHEAEIYAIEPRINEQTRTLLVRARAPNPGARLRPGAFAEIELPLLPQPDALLVPPVAVVPGLTEKNLYVVREGLAVRRPVKLGVRTATQVQILAGLEAGETVITSGIQSLRSGLPVEVSQLTD